MKCPNCGGALIENTAFEKRVCPYCDSVFDIPKPKEPKEEPKKDSVIKGEYHVYDDYYAAGESDAVKLARLKLERDKLRMERKERRYRQRMEQQRIEEEARKKEQEDSNDEMLIVAVLALLMILIPAFMLMLK